MNLIHSETVNKYERSGASEAVRIQFCKIIQTFKTCQVQDRHVFNLGGGVINNLVMHIDKTCHLKYVNAHLSPQGHCGRRILCVLLSTASGIDGSICVFSHAGMF